MALTGQYRSTKTFIASWRMGPRLPDIVPYLSNNRPLFPTAFGKRFGIIHSFSRTDCVVFGFLTLSRFGAWTHNIIAQNVVQITVNVEHRGRFSGVEVAFVSAAEIARWSCGAVWPRPEQFPGLGIASFCVVVSSYLLFAIWAVRRNRRELGPIRLD